MPYIVSDLLSKTCEDKQVLVGNQMNGRVLSGAWRVCYVLDAISSPYPRPINKDIDLLTSGKYTCGLGNVLHVW